MRSICRIPECGRIVNSNGLCKNHIRKLRLYGDPLYKKVVRKCCVVDCHRKHYSNGYCDRHWNRIKSHGSINSTKDFHGMEGSTEYATWLGMKGRCYNKNNHKYHRYGARGIYVCDEWKNSFSKFFADMGPRPPGLQLDRINNDGPYSKENCRWVTREENSRNRSDNTFKKEDIIYIRSSTERNCDLARKFGCQRQTIGNIRARRTWKEI